MQDVASFQCLERYFKIHYEEYDLYQFFINVNWLTRTDLCRFCHSIIEWEKNH